MDLNKIAINLDKVDLIVANLLIEYIGLKNFIININQNLPQYVLLSYSKG